MLVIVPLLIVLFLCVITGIVLAAVFYFLPASLLLALFLYSPIA